MQRLFVTQLLCIYSVDGGAVEGSCVGCIGWLDCGGSVALWKVNREKEGTETAVVDWVLVDGGSERERERSMESENRRRREMRGLWLLTGATGRERYEEGE